MLSNNALQILTLLEEQEGKPVTAKRLSLLLGISERSIKSYMNEISEFCDGVDCTLIRKSGKGFIFYTTKEGRRCIEQERQSYKENLSREARISYIMYILLTGWTTYTVALFADELNVSKHTVYSDLDYIEPLLEKFGLQLNRIAGKGIFLVGDEFVKRKAFKHFCVTGIKECDLQINSDARISMEDESIMVTNYGKENVLQAIKIVKEAERVKEFYYTGYSFTMIVYYLSISLMRIKQKKYITSFHNIDIENIEVKEELIPIGIKKLLERECNLHIPDTEGIYLEYLFQSGDYQHKIENNEKYTIFFEEKIDEICKNIISYLQEVIGEKIFESDRLFMNIKQFLPFSILRIYYGFEIKNPFFEDIRVMYPEIFSIHYSLEWFYKKYIGILPNNQELSFLSLFIGGAIKRNNNRIKIVLMSHSGLSITNIIAKRLEEEMRDIEIVSICSILQKDKIDSVKYDLIVLIDNSKEVIEDRDDIVKISSRITEEDKNKIKQFYLSNKKNYSLMSKRYICDLFPKELIFYKIQERNKENIISFLCSEMEKYGYVNSQYEQEVLKRESIHSTYIGNGIAIPHAGNEFVLKSGIAVLKLEQAIYWGKDEEVELIFLLGIHFDNIALTRNFFKVFTEVIENKVAELKQCDSINKLQDIFQELV